MLYRPQQLLPQLRHQLASNTPQLVEGLYTEAAVLVAITDHASTPELILTQRAPHLKLHPGEAAFPGGKQDKSDPSLLATALREANEEIALSAGQVEYLGCLDQRLTRTDIKVSTFVGLIPADVNLRANPDELDLIYRVPLEYFFDQNNLQVAEKAFRGSVRRVPHFTYQQHSIWGVTALIIMDLMNTVFDADLSIK